MIIHDVLSVSIPTHLHFVWSENPFLTTPSSITHLALAPFSPWLHTPVPCLCPCLCLSLTLIHHMPPPCLHPPLCTPAHAHACACPHPCHLCPFHASAHTLIVPCWPSPHLCISPTHLFYLIIVPPNFSPHQSLFSSHQQHAHPQTELDLWSKVYSVFYSVIINMLTLKSELVLWGGLLLVFLSLHQCRFGIGLTGTVSILSWEEVYCIVIALSGYGWYLQLS